jgi:hypothetical protein
MRRIITVLAVAALMAVMLVATAAPAFAFKGPGHPPRAADNSCEATAPVTPQPCKAAGKSPPPGIDKK